MLQIHFHLINDKFIKIFKEHNYISHVVKVFRENLGLVPQAMVTPQMLMKFNLFLMAGQTNIHRKNDVQVNGAIDMVDAVPAKFSFNNMVHASRCIESSRISEFSTLRNKRIS